MQKEREVIVVGAGPSGALTATLLAQHGHDVLLLDKHEFPRVKTCGDAVPSQAIDILREAGMEAKVEAAVSRDEFYPLTQMRLVSPKGYQTISLLRKSENGSNSYVAPRLYFDALIQLHAIEAGAEFRQVKVEEPLIENGRVVGVKARNHNGLENIRARIIVGADGVASVIARTLRTKVRHVDAHRALALRAYVEGIEINPHEIEFYLYQNILPGYAWIFPRGNGLANIGLGMRLDHYRKKPLRLKAMLEEFLAMPVITKRLKNGWKIRDIASWPLNFGSQKDLSYSFDGALLVGDAAGFINPLTGGGIHRSLISGQLAAQVIQKALHSGDTTLTGLQQYEELCKDSLLGDLRRAYHMQKLLLRFPFLIDIFIKYFQGNNSLVNTLLTKL